MDIREKIGNRIRDARLKAGFNSAVELARQADINSKNLYLYESGERYPKPDVIAAIAKHTNADPAWLMGITDKEQPSSSKGFVTPDGDADLSFKNDLLDTLGLSTKNLSLMTITGDAMSPTLQSGDKIVIDGNNTEVTEGLFAVEANGTKMIRRLLRNLDGGLSVIADNKEYPEQTLAAKESSNVSILGKVVWFGRAL